MPSKQFVITINSPYGNQPIEEWRHWINKVAQESKSRWGIEITIEEPTETDHSLDFE